MIATRELFAALLTIAVKQARGYYLEMFATTVSPTCDNPTVQGGGQIAPEGTLTCGASVVGDTTSAPSGGNGLGNCGPFVNVADAKGYWYRFEDTSTTFASVAFSTCNATPLDTFIQVFDDAGGTCNNPVCKGGNNDLCSKQSYVQPVFSGSGVFYVYVAGFTGEGSFTLTATCFQ